MASSTTPNPVDPENVMVIRDVLPGITTLSMPFLRFGQIKIGGRTTIIKLSSGALFIISPLPLTPAVHTKLSSLGGSVAYIAAPNSEHYLSIPSWARAFPAAKLICPPGIPAKLPALTFHAVITPDTHPSIGEDADKDLDYELVDAHPNRELVFFHRASRTLVQADLLFNLPATEQYSRAGGGADTGFATRRAVGLMNTVGEAMGQRRVLWYLFSRRDRVRFDASVERINSWGFENIIPCHGELILGEGKGVFEKVMKWHLQGKSEK